MPWYRRIAWLFYPINVVLESIQAVKQFHPVCVATQLAQAGPSLCIVHTRHKIRCLKAPLRVKCMVRSYSKLDYSCIHDVASLERSCFEPRPSQSSRAQKPTTGSRGTPENDRRHGGGICMALPLTLPRQSKAAEMWRFAPHLADVLVAFPPVSRGNSVKCFIFSSMPTLVPILGVPLLKHVNQRYRRYQGQRMPGY